MSVISPWPSSSLTRRGKTTSTTGATTVSAGTDLATAGLARRSASIACVHRTTGSLSPSSSVSHATGFRAASASRHAASRVVFPKPAGQATRVSLRSDPLRRRSSRRSRGIVCSRTDGGCSFVPTRIGCPAARRTPSPATEPCRSEVPWRACGTAHGLTARQTRCLPTGGCFLHRAHSAYPARCGYSEPEAERSPTYAARPGDAAAAGRVAGAKLSICTTASR